jgi:hypothetical protein
VLTIHPDRPGRTDLAKLIAQRDRFAPSATNVRTCSGAAAIVTL